MSEREEKRGSLEWLNDVLTMPEGPAMPPEDAFRAAALEHGLTLPSRLIADGQIHRFSTDGKRRSHDDSGWYVLHGEGVPAGAFGDWRSGVDGKWHGSTVGISPEELEAMQARSVAMARMREQERAKRRAAVAELCSEIWDSAAPAPPDHPYLARKGIRPHGARVMPDGRLIVPLITQEGTVSSLQYIPGNGPKRYHKDGTVSGTFWYLGDPREAERVYICEGFATAATVHEVTGAPVLIAYSASGLVPVAEMAREWYHGDLCIVADHDASGTGQRYAEQAAAKHGARYVIGSPTKGEDANDYHLAGGDLRSLLEPRKSDWLIPGSEFFRQPAPAKWLIRSWLPAESLITLIGPPGSGKSFLALDWSMRVACGVPEWCGNDVRRGSVVYLAGEGHYGLRARGAAWLARIATETGETKSPAIWFSSCSTDIDTNAGYLQAREALLSVSESPSLVVVDTLYRFLAGDENVAADMRKLCDACSKLQREFGCTVLLVHHTGVGELAQRRGRGSSALKGALDAEILLTPDEDGAKRHKLEVLKMKDADAPRSILGMLSPQMVPGWVDDRGEPVSSVVWAPEDDILGELVNSTDERMAEKAERVLRATFAHVGESWVSDGDVLDRLREHGGSLSLSDCMLARPDVAYRDGCGWRRA